MADMRDRIRQMLDEKGWSARQLARMAGLRSENQVNAMLRGEQSTFRADTLQQIANALGTTADWLQTGAGRKLSPVMMSDDDEETFAEASAQFRKIADIFFPGQSEEIEDALRELEKTVPSSERRTSGEWSEAIVKLFERNVVRLRATDGPLYRLKRFVDLDQRGDVHAAARALGADAESLEMMLVGSMSVPTELDAKVAAYFREKDDARRLAQLEKSAADALKALVGPDATAGKHASLDLATTVMKYVEHRRRE